ncbi:MAG TPA: AAA family ATPase [Fimbriimonadaceae bacterium]|nr:AAA family ATPase [Fimbriimonadaceae bacterium]
MSDFETLKALVAQFNTEELQADDDRFVDFDSIREDKILMPLEQRIVLGDPTNPITALLSGPRGVGKTSLILRLADRLRVKGFTVIYMDATDALDLNDIEFTDFLAFLALSVLRQLDEQKVPGFSKEAVYVKNLKERFKDFWQTKIEVSEAKVSVGHGSAVETEVKLAFQENQSALKNLRRELEEQASQIIFAVRKILTDANQALVQAGRQGLAVIVDGLDKIVWRTKESDSKNMQRKFFEDRMEQLSSFGVNIVYVAPISIVYSTVGGQWEAANGINNVVVPMVTICKDHDPKGDGLAKFDQVIEKRCAKAGITSTQLFDSAATKDYLVRMTGGHLRHLMKYVQAALVRTDALPLTSKEVEAVVRIEGQSMARQIPANLWQKLREFGKPQERSMNDEDSLSMLFNLYVFEYKNGKTWYEVNPVIRETDLFKLRS